MNKRKSLFLGFISIFLLSLAGCSSTPEKRSITFKNYDGSVTLDTQFCDYGGSVTYGGETPTKPDDDYTYTFADSWLTSINGDTIDDLSNVTSDRVVYPKFSEVERQYFVTFKNYDGSEILETKSCEYDGSVSYSGETPNKPGGSTYYYVFDNAWLSSIDGTFVDNLSNVTSDRVVYPKFSKIEKKSQLNFGIYPQSKVTDESLLSSLTTAAGELPSSNDAKAWTDYGYYINSAITSYMWYQDIYKDGLKYRGVYFTSNRPYYISEPSTYSSQKLNGYEPLNVYWFKFEPISWKVLDVNESSVFIFSVLNLDAQDFHYTIKYNWVNSKCIYANNYKESYIRSWLIDTFYNTAFSASEQEKIITTNVDNSVASTGYETNPYVCENTNDKVFLLSRAEATNTDYGFYTDGSHTDHKSTDYAYSQGIVDVCYWWLRSPVFNDGAETLMMTGSHISRGDVIRTNLGVLPALWISR